MRIRHSLFAAGFAMALIASVRVIASADQPVTIIIAPVYTLNGTGDANAVPPPGLPLYCPNQVSTTCIGSPPLTSDLRLDYGLKWSIAKRWNLNYTHTNFDYSIGRVDSLPVAPIASLGFPGCPPATCALETGDINDLIDKVVLNYAVGHGIGLALHYSSEQRVFIAAYSNPPGSCFLNSEKCPGGASNPASINGINWGFDVSYAFGPHARLSPPMFQVQASVDYWPRPSPGNCGAPTAQPACGTNGIAGYVGSGTTFPYSISMLPLSAMPTVRGFLPFLAYARDISWFHAENTPEVFNVVSYGFTQRLPYDLAFSYTNAHFNGCPCSDTVPPPDSLRFVMNIFKLSYELKI